MRSRGGNYFEKKTIRQASLEGKTVLLRADYNVPLNNKGEITDDYRIIQSKPTLDFLQEAGAKIIVISHLGRPPGKPEPSLSLAPVADRLSELLGQQVSFVEECIGDKVTVASHKLRPGEVILLENLRFHPEEEANDATFAKKLALDSRAQLFVQDGFGVVHRENASTEAITQYLPSVGGLLLEREYNQILGVMENPEKPLTAVFGGAKVSDKIAVIERFIDRADRIVIGGAMANTFLQYKGYDVGKSLVEKDTKAILDAIYKKAQEKIGKENVDQFILLPTDVAVAESTVTKQPRKEVAVGAVHDKELILDIGTYSIKAAIKAIGSEGTVVWNGPLGLTENPVFTDASVDLANHLARSRKIVSVVGGGDTADFVLHWNKEKAQKLTHISTGGGASLELMSGKKLPGVESLLE